jgi:hypothetical protein
VGEGSDRQGFKLIERCCIYISLGFDNGAVWARDDVSGMACLVQDCRFSFFIQKYGFFKIEDAFYDKIQNAAYSHSESWHTRDSAGAVDG